MKKTVLVFLSALAVALSSYAQELSDTVQAGPAADAAALAPAEPVASPEADFAIDEKLEEGVLTSKLNNAIEKGIDKAAAKSAEGEQMTYGRTVTDWVSAPKFGGYVIGTYKYASGDDSNTFGVRLIRVYVDGTILRDFKYRLQVQLSGTPHVKDYYIDWCRWKEFGIKAGQFKRCFTFENPYNPWDVGVGDYSQLVKQFAGMGDNMVGEANMGGRDIGVLLHGDLFPIMADKHRLLHYELGVYNGQGINSLDKNKRKDVIATVQFQPLKSFYIGAFYWNGTYNNGSEDLARNRFAVGAKYETSEWSARAEYARECSSNFHGADAFYATLGIPCTKWLKTYVKYDNYNATGDWAQGNHIFSIAPDFQVHKNLMFQLQYNCVYNATASTSLTHQFWIEAYFRF